MKILLSWFLIIGTILNLVNTLEAKSASKKKRDSLKNGIQSTRKADDDRCKEFFLDGEILYRMQMSGIYEDSKTYVDKPTKLPLSDVYRNYNYWPTENFTDFLAENYHEPGYDLVIVEPTDWKENPSFIEKISDNQLKEFAKELNQKWKNLLRKFDKTKLCDGCCSSAIYTSNSFIIPGGRFREYYYWDTYWVVEGLLTCGMSQTVKGIIQNFFEIVQENGFVPNGARTYYLNRSQPPFLIQMVYAYYKATNALDFVRENIDLLDREYEFWLNNRSVTYEKDGQNYVLNMFNVDGKNPRPESYREDYENAEASGDEDTYYSNIITGAESGWDFSSRWFENPKDIKTIQIRDIIPVDLNSILFKNEKILHEFHTLIGNTEKAANYETALKQREIAINKVMWDNDKKQWADLNKRTGKLHMDHKYISDLSPLWSGVNPPTDIDSILKQYEKLLMSHKGGVPSSDIESGEQWDFPNVWAPHVHLIVEYLYNNNRKDQALDIANRFVKTVYCGWTSTKAIFEKYNAEKIGSGGGGGEYVVQEGFGWTNGVVIKFMEYFGNELKVGDCSSSSNIIKFNLSIYSLSVLFFLFFFKLSKY